MIGVRTIVCINMLDVQNLPGGLTRLQENVIQTVTEENAAPRPFDLMRGSIFVLVDLTEGILPIRADVFDLVCIFVSIEITCNDSGTPQRDLIHPCM